GASSMESVAENIFDSLYPLKFVDEFKSCMDVGSGGGFPAIPLAIAKPEVYFILVEPRQKRACFLQNIALELGLGNVQVRATSIQDVPIAEVNNLSLITSRALMDAKTLIALCRKFLKSDGYFLLYKGSRFRQEMPSMSVEECFVRENRIYYYKHSRDL
ncbi:16S rRNA (guanine(527)-N(7))-methyltransferase RsmG, partial [uncultured Helicobacter sp.]